MMALFCVELFLCFVLFYSYLGCFFNAILIGAENHGFPMMSMGSGRVKMFVPCDFYEKNKGGKGSSGSESKAVGHESVQSESSGKTTKLLAA